MTSMPTESAALSWENLLAEYQRRIHRDILDKLAAASPKTPLRDACEYALTGGGKRLRPAIVHMVAEALPQDRQVGDAALAIEFFHTASLIVDDLPCMDDDDQRRNKPSLHRAYNEVMALLSSYALIATGYECLAGNARLLERQGRINGEEAATLTLLALENATYNTGFSGATGGQLLDLAPPDVSGPTLQQVIRMKTVSLFEIAFVLGWLYGGGGAAALPQVKEAAWHYGMAFQLADDFSDVADDCARPCGVNYVVSRGAEEAGALLAEHRRGYLQTLQRLQIDSPALQAIGTLLCPQSAE